MDLQRIRNDDKRVIAYDRKWGQRMKTFGERSRLSHDLSSYLVEKSRHMERISTNTNLHKTKNNDIKTMSERTSAYTSEYQISPKISRTLSYAWPIRYSVTAPLVIYTSLRSVNVIFLLPRSRSLLFAFFRHNYQISYIGSFVIISISISKNMNEN